MSTTLKAKYTVYIDSGAAQLFVGTETLNQKILSLSRKSAVFVMDR
jgi:hypothetical protein